MYVQIRVWHLAIPLPGIPSQPIAVMPVDDKNDASQLKEWHDAITSRLDDLELKTLSYACDGTSVELGVQKHVADSAAEYATYVFAHPVHDQPRIELRLPLSRQRVPTVMIQDSKHCRKDCRNAILSGARFLVIGNYTVMYSQLRTIADEDHSPLKLRDVDSRLDRQDDFAAARNFSESVLNFVVVHHPDWRGLIVYLFVFGELIDGYQSRSISHRERVIIAFRTLFFVDIWQAFIKKVGYPQSHCLAPETIKIIQTECYGLVGLILAHRDFRSDPHLPLCPWLHSTEAAEHNYGLARKTVPNFTVMDYIRMVFQLCFLSAASFVHTRAQSAGKTTASGYNHTYYDASKFNSREAANCPSNEEIQADIRTAHEQAANLMACLGVVVRDLDMQSGALPSLSTLLERTGLHDDFEHDVDTDTPSEKSLLEEFFAGRHEDNILRAETEERLEELHRAHVSSIMFDMELM